MRFSLPFNALLSFILCATLFLAGCSQSKTERPPTKDKISKDIKTGNDKKSSSTTPNIIQPVGDGADAAVQTVINGLQANNPAVVWEALPASYQQDVNDLTHQFANRMDAEVWNKTFATVQRAVHIMKKQRKFYLEKEAARNSPLEMPRIALNFDHALQLAETLVGSDIANLESLKTVDAGQLIGKTGGELMQQFDLLAKFAASTPLGDRTKLDISRMQVKLISTDGDNAILQLIAPHIKTGKPQESEVEFVKVEGKWIPKEIAINWKNDIANAKENFKQMTPASMINIKQRLLGIPKEGKKSAQAGVLTQVNLALDKMENATDAKAFSTASAQAMMPLIGFAMSPPGLNAVEVPAEKKPIGQGKTVTLIVEGTLTEKDIEALEDQLLTMDTEVEQLVSTKRLNAKSISIQINPVYNIAKFAKSVPFGRVTKIDTEENKIYVSVLKNVSE